jgi:hypothetical protein
MDQRQFFATVLAVILLGISLAMGVNMVIADTTTETQATAMSSQTHETSMTGTTNFESIDVIWSAFPHVYA